MRRGLWILLTPTLLVLVSLYLFDRFVAPTLLQFVISKIESVSRDQGPMEIKIGQAKLTYLPVGFKAKEILLSPKKKLQSQLSKIEIEEISVEMALFALVTGKLKIGNLNIESPRLQINVKMGQESKSPESIPLQFNWSSYFEKLELFPIEQITVKNLNLKVMEKRTLKVLQFEPVEIQALKLPEIFQLKISAPQIFPSWDKEQVLKTSLQFSAIATPEEIRVQQLQIENRTLKFDLSGQVKASNNSKKMATQVYWKGKLNLDQFKQAWLLIAPQTYLPKLTGSLQANGNWEPQKTDLLRSQFNIQTRDVSIADFKIGNADIKGQLSQSKLSFEKIRAEHPAGQVELNGTQLHLSSEFPIQSKLELKSLDFPSLFTSIKLKKVPIQGTAQGSAPCQGKIIPFNLQCAFEVTLSDFSVSASRDSKATEIVALETISAQGDLTVNLEQLKYTSELRMPNSKGQSQGTIKFKEGFQINFAAPLLDWRDVKNLANLSLEGHSQLTGSTSGNSRSATFNASLAGQEQAIAGFFLGKIKAELNYKDGHLIFPYFESQINASKLTGALNFNFSESRLKGEIQSPQADLADIQKVLARPIPIPVEFSGAGPIQARFEGPFDFWKLDVNLTAHIPQPQIAGEILNDLNINIESRNEIFNIKRLSALRNQTKLEFMGTVGPEKSLDLQGTLQNARLEESDNISRIGWPLSGDLNAQIKLRGTITEPELTLNGQVSQMILDENQVPNSSFRLLTEKETVTAEGQFFGNQVQALLKWPTGDSRLPVKARFKSQDWDYTPWLSLFNAGAINEETRGKLTADINLQSDSGDWDELTGSLRFETLSLTRQSLTLENQKPITIQAQSGKYHTNNFILRDQNEGVLRIKLDETSTRSLNMLVEANTDIKLIQIFAPLFEEISGQIQINANITGPISKPITVGEMSLKNGYFKIKKFPHAFEKISLQSTFSQSRLLLNEIQGTLGGGTLRGEGSLQFQGPDDIPIYIRARAQDISLNIPTGVKTGGDAEISFTGRKFPYLLSAHYRIKTNLIEMNFGSETNAENRRNEYLPQNIKQQIADPLELDIQLNFEKPIQIKNSLLEAQATGPLAVKGLLTNPVLVGQLKSLKGSQLFFKDKPFLIQTANIQFTDPKQTNPELFISAQTRVDIYDVTLLVQGTAKDPTIRLSSVPPLSDNDLTSLLALGVTSSKLAEVDSREQQNQTANEVFAAAFQSTGLSKKVQSATGFNVQLSNSFDTTRNISVPKFTVSRKINKKTNATVAFPVTGDQKTPEGRIQYNITDSFSINGSYETRKFDQNTTSIEQRETPSILGLDLEFSREFK